jgi:hypothetical protein
MPFPFGRRAEPESPSLGGEEGLRVAVRDLRSGDGRLAFDLLLGYRFTAPFVSRFERFTDALVFTIEDAAGGVAVARRAIDPTKRYPYRAGPNWLGPSAQDARTSWSAGWLRIPCLVSPAPSPWIGPSVFVSASLQGHRSNTVGIDVVAAKAASWREGRPFPVSTVGSAPPMPSPSAPPPNPASDPALSIAWASAFPRLEIRLALAPEELASGGAEGWLRSIFVQATSREDQVPWIASWLGERIVLADDVELDGSGGGRCVLSCDLDAVFGERLPSGVHDVQVSARRHRSAVLEVVRP